MSDIFEKLKSGAGKVAKEAERVARVKQIELEIGSIKRQIEAQYNKLGEMAYNSSVKKEPESPEAADVVAKISELNGLIKFKEEEIKKINQDDVEAPAAQVPMASPTPGKKFCTSCGKENESGVKFCCECGARIG